MVTRRRPGALFAGFARRSRSTRAASRPKRSRSSCVRRACLADVRLAGRGRHRRGRAGRWQARGGGGSDPPSGRPIRRPSRLEAPVQGNAIASRSISASTPWPGPWHGGRGKSTAEHLRATMLAMHAHSMGCRPARRGLDRRRPLPALGCIMRAIVKAIAMLPSFQRRRSWPRPRDAILVELSTAGTPSMVCPNRGYGRPSICRARRHGPCPAHRMTFAPVAQTLRFLRAARLMADRRAPGRFPPPEARADPRAAAIAHRTQALTVSSEGKRRCRPRSASRPSRPCRP
jgi:hypothetical protein